jgi:hypothetical protein
MAKPKRGTIRYFIVDTWKKLNKRSVNGTNPKWDHRQSVSYLKKGIRLEMTKGEFRAWCLKNADMIMGLYNCGKTPSIDRLDSSKNYSIDNIRILDNEINKQMGREARQVAVIAENKTTGVQIVAPSIIELSRSINLSTRTIRHHLSRQSTSQTGYTIKLQSRPK